MTATHHRVVKPHVSEYPEPITFSAGISLAVGERYEGPEGWDDWFFCSAPGQSCGWVPGQVIGAVEAGIATALEDYTARELTVDAGDVVIGTRRLNGWLWADRQGTPDSGWVPLANLEDIAT